MEVLFIAAPPAGGSGQDRVTTVSANNEFHNPAAQSLINSAIVQHPLIKYKMSKVKVDCAIWSLAIEFYMCM